jgi:FkbM family methyltransferase
MKLIISKLLFITGLSFVLKIYRPNYTIRFWPTSMSLWAYNNPPDSLEIFIGDYLLKDEVFVDIGSNIGTYALTASNAVQNDGLVVCFEPSKKAYKYLVKNFALKGNTKSRLFLLNNSIGDNNQLITFRDFFIDVYSSNIYAGEDYRLPPSFLNKFFRDYEVIQVRLDSVNILKQTDKIDLLKIDVEGSEFNVIQGAEKILAKIHLIVFEYSTQQSNYYSNSFDQISFYLKDKNFDLYELHLNSRELVKLVSSPNNKTELIAINKRYPHVTERFTSMGYKTSNDKI